MLIRELENYYRLLLLRPEATTAYRRNRLKEYLHSYLLSFIYKNPQYNHLVFYGGTCLRHCFDLPRLSEDLDFEDLSAAVPISELAEDLSAYFKNSHDFPDLVSKVQKYRIYIKFPVLKAWKKGLSPNSPLRNMMIALSYGRELIVW